MTIYIPVIEKTNEPLYKRLTDTIERDVKSGLLHPGVRLPTHREMADNLGINVSTVTRAYREAEKIGLVAGTVGRGTFVASDACTISSMRTTGPYPAGIIELGLVGPLTDFDPDLSEYLLAFSRQKNLSAYMTYGDPAGMETHRKTGADWMNRFGMTTTAENVFICAGGQHALTCTFAGVFKPGQRIAAESLTYPGIKSLAGLLGLRLVSIAMDDEGMIPESLDTACRRDDLSGVYLMPGVHNPTLACMSAKRREAVAEVIARHGLTLIEDDAYSPYRENQPPPVSSLIPDNGVLIASVSKIFWAGMRVAFVAASKDKRNRIIGAVHNTMWMVPTLNSAIVASVIEDGNADKVLAAKKSELAKRLELARSFFSSSAIKSIPYGNYIWVNILETWTGKGLESALQEQGVNIFSAEKFSVGNSQPPRTVRLSLTGENDISRLRKGLEIVSGIISSPLPVMRPVM